MCGRFSVSQTNRIQERFIIEQNNLVTPLPRYNIAPAQQIPIILYDGANKLTMFRWGQIHNRMLPECIIPVNNKIT